MSMSNLDRDEEDPFDAFGMALDDIKEQVKAMGDILDSEDEGDEFEPVLPTMEELGWKK